MMSGSLTREPRVAAALRGGASAFWVRRQETEALSRSIHRRSTRQRRKIPHSNRKLISQKSPKRRWWPSRGFAWRTRSTARTSLSGGTWPSRRWVRAANYVQTTSNSVKVVRRRWFRSLPASGLGVHWSCGCRSEPRHLPAAWLPRSCDQWKPVAGSVSICGKFKRVSFNSLVPVTSLKLTTRKYRSIAEANRSINVSSVWCGCLWKSSRY